MLFHVKNGKSFTAKNTGLGIRIMSEFKNYIFDLYGTLIDIETDERKLSLWSFMAQLYNVYGCEWSAAALRDGYFKLDEEERRGITLKSGIAHPEIQLEKVFARLLFECPKTHGCSFFIDEMNIDMLRSMYASDKDKILASVMRSEWAVSIANAFRITSRKYLKLYKNTLSTLKALKKSGKKVFLLSNAQKIFTYPEIEETGILPYFDAIYISSDYGLKKPEPDFMEILIKEHELKKNETVMIGNEVESDVDIAIKCGVSSVYLNTYGYSSADINERIYELSYENPHIPQKLKPTVIMSGDIGKILS